MRYERERIASQLRGIATRGYDAAQSGAVRAPYTAIGIVVPMRRTFSLTDT